MTLLQVTAATTFHSPLLPKFETVPGTQHEYLSAPEAEHHTRDLSLQVQEAVAIGQIARLLETICVQDVHDSKAGGAIESVECVPIEEFGESRFVNYREPGSIEAWARKVALVAPGLHSDSLTVGAKFNRVHKDGEGQYSRGSVVVDDTAEILDVFENRHSEVHTSHPQPAKVTTTAFPRSTEWHDCSLAIRIADLSARLDRLDVGIEDFSNRRCDALAWIELDAEELSSM